VAYKKDVKRFVYKTSQNTSFTKLNQGKSEVKVIQSKLMKYITRKALK